MRAEGISLSAMARVVGASVAKLSAWVKKRGVGDRASDAVSGVADEWAAEWRARVYCAFYEMWAYLGVRRGERRKDLWIWTAVVKEPNGVRWRMYEVGRKGESALSRLLGRLPGADRYETGAYPVYEWLPRGRRAIGTGGAVNRNEGLHSKLRSKLNRLVRRTKGYTKSVERLKHLLAIVFDERLNQSIKPINPAG